MTPAQKAMPLRAGFVLSIVAVGVFMPLPAAADEPPGPAGQPIGGVSVEEHIRTFPPAPVAVQAEAIDAGVIVFWERPPQPDPKMQVSYDREIEKYRVYRMGEAFDRTLIGETAGTWFLDETVPPGGSRRYAVSAVHRSGHESDLSGEARFRVP